MCDQIGFVKGVIFTSKTSLDVFSLGWEHVWTCSVLGDHVCEMKKVTQ